MYSYDYSKVEYINNKTEVCIICPEHGEFWQTPINHYHFKHGCPKCSGQGLDQDDIIKRFIKVHGDKYDYSKVKYTKWDEKICIICPEHGEFWQTPNKHYCGRGCPICKQSRLEKEIRTLLDENNIDYKVHYRPKWLDYLELDFYLPKYNVGIECQGEQHFRPVDFGWNDEKITKEKFIGQIERDIKKLNLSQTHLNGLYYFSDYKSSTFLSEKLYKDKHKLLKEIIKNKNA